MAENYRKINMDTYYRKGVFEHFTKDCMCSTSMTAKIDVTKLYEYSKKTKTKFYINVLYLITKTLNARDDYKMAYLYQSKELILYDKIHPTQYVFHEETETCTPVYSTYHENYFEFYKNCEKDIELAKQTKVYGLDVVQHPNWFDASFLPWISYDSLHVELPDGYLYFMPIINWGKFEEESGRKKMPVSVRLNHAIADGYLVAKVFQILEEEMKDFVMEHA